MEGEGDWSRPSSPWSLGPSLKIHYPITSHQIGSTWHTSSIKQQSVLFQPREDMDICRQSQQCRLTWRSSNGRGLEASMLPERLRHWHTQIGKSPCLRIVQWRSDPGLVLHRKSVSWSSSINYWAFLSFLELGQSVFIRVEHMNRTEWPLCYARILSSRRHFPTS